MTTTFEVQNLKCQGCANTIITKLSSLAGISDIAVTNETHSVSFQYENESILVEVKNLLQRIGYPVV